MMTQQQSPFEAVKFAENPEPRCPLVLLLDTSLSMQGQKLDELNKGLQTLKEELEKDPLASKRVEIAIVTFGPVQLIHDFTSVHDFVAAQLVTTGSTPTGEATSLAVKMISDRKSMYKQHGISYFRPWIIMITDGEPTDDITNAANLVRQGEKSKAFSFFVVCVEGADVEKMRALSERDPLKLKGLMFRELFAWLSSSMSAVSASRPGDAVNLPRPDGPKGWASVD